jgi:uncharacterized protein (DUF362 family)
MRRKPIHGRRRVSRRDCLKAGGAALAAMALPLGLASCDGSIAYDDTPDPGSPPEAPVDPSSPGASEASSLTLPKLNAPQGGVTVGIARHLNIQTMVNNAISLAGGLDDIKQGDTVCIKPNITGPFVPVALNFRISTSPLVLWAVIRAVKTRTAAHNITVAEASAFNWPTLGEAAETGILAVCIAEGVKFQPWEWAPYSYVCSPKWQYLKKPLRMPKSLADGKFKHFIGVPFLKNHELCVGTDAEYTCCIKQHVGVCNPIDRLGGQGLISTTSVPAHMLGIHSVHLGEICAELHMMVPKHTMDIVDATDVILAGGPAGPAMTVVHPHLVIASKDTVAADSLSLAVMRHYATIVPTLRPYVHKSVWEQAQIVRAQELGLGRAKEDIVVKQSGVKEIESILKKWS